MSERDVPSEAPAPDPRVQEWADWTRQEAFEMFEAAMLFDHPYSHMAKYDPETVAGLAASLVGVWDLVAAERADRERLRSLLVRAYEALIATDAPVADEARLEEHLTLLDDLMEAAEAGE